MRVYHQQKARVEMNSNVVRLPLRHGLLEPAWRKFHSFACYFYELLLHGLFHDRFTPY